ncbi:MAG: S8 family serine peptidase [Myxococcota bacterium]
MTSPLDRVNAALSHFFGSYLSDAQRKILADLSQGASSGALEIFAGTYKAWAGGAVSCIGSHSVTPKWGIQAANKAIAYKRGKPKATSLDPGSGAHARPLVWLREVADAKVDTQAEIERIIQNINYYTSTVGGGAARDAKAWASAVLKARAAGEIPDHLEKLHAVPKSFAKLTDDLTELRQVFHHFFSYKQDGSYYARWAKTPHDTPDNLSSDAKTLTITELQLRAGEVYLYAIVPEAFLAGGGTSKNRFREVVWSFSFNESKVSRVSVKHTVACAVSGADFYDFIAFHADDGLRTLHTKTGRTLVPDSAAKSMTPGIVDLLASAPSDPAKRKAFIKASAHSEGNETHVPVFLELNKEGPLPEGVELFGRPGELLQLASVPIDELASLAALPHVEWVSEPTPLEMRSTNAAAQINLSKAPLLYRHRPMMKGPLVEKVQQALKTAGHYSGGIDGEFGDKTKAAVVKFQKAKSIKDDGIVGPTTASKMGLTWDAVNKPGGAGVVIGVIDSGIHGTHPAFRVGGTAAGAPRIVSTWEPNGTGTAPGPRLAGLNGGYFAGTYGETEGDKKLNSNQWLNRGAELVGAATSGMRDGSSGHGTHVAGIAAGTAVGGANPCPAGMAPQASVVSIKGYHDGSTSNPIETGINDWQVIRAIEYVREIASHQPKVKDPKGVDQPAPVVINMSFGHHQHAHDSTDNLAKWLDGFSMRNSDKSRVKGVLLCAAAGNERGKDYHQTVNVPKQSGATKGSFILNARMAPRIGSVANIVTTTGQIRGPRIEDVNIWIDNHSDSNTASDLEIQVQSQGSVVQTANIAQRANNDFVWSTFLGAGVHIGISHGPKRGRNNRFNLRVVIQSAKGVVAQAGGYPLPNVGGTYATVNVDRNGQIIGGGGAPIALYPVGAWVSNSGGTATFQDNRSWQIVIRNTNTSRARVGHAWMGKENSRFMNNTFTTRTGVDTHLICSPAHSPAVISVAATTSDLKFNTVGGAQDDSPWEWGPPPVNSHDVTGAITSFSSPGPLNTTRADPGVDIAAPGSNLIAARGTWNSSTSSLIAKNDKDINTNARYMAGTSMASPVVAGLLANILAVEPTLTVEEVRDRFKRSSIPTKLSDGTAMSAAVRNNPVGTLETGAPRTTNDWGEGLLDARRMK